MAQGTIQIVKPSKSGKSLAVTVDGKRYFAKLTTGLSAHVGKMITFDPSIQTLDDGGTITWINEFTLSGSGGPAVNGGGMAASPGPQASAYHPLVSNLAAHLIAAGKTPGDLRAWFSACKAILEGKTIREPGSDDADPEFNDPLAF